MEGGGGGAGKEELVKRLSAIDPIDPNEVTYESVGVGVCAGQEKEI
jgi:hypothetical protein